MSDFILSKIKWLKGKLYNQLRPKKLSPRHVKYRDSDFVVFSNDDVGWTLVSDGAFEREELDCLCELIKKDDVCLDIGANIGIYSVIMGKMAPDGKVIAFEPVRLNRCMLELNLALNMVENVQINDFVVSDTVKMIRFSVSTDSAYSSIVSTKRKSEAKAIDIQSKTLDVLFYETGTKIDVVKLDVEGAELLVLNGAQKIFSDRRYKPRVFLIELNQQNQAVYDYKPEDVVNFMESHGYSTFSIVNKGKMPGWPHQHCVEDVLFIRKD